MKNFISNKNVLFISLGFFCVFFGYGAVQQYLIPLFKLQGRENLAFMSLLFIYGSFLISGIFAPKIIPKFGLKKSLITGANTYLIYTISIISKNTNFFLLASVLLGIGATFLWVSSGKIITDSSTDKSIGKNLGIQLAGTLLGSFLGIALGGVLLKTLSFNQLYILFASAIVVGLPFFTKIKFKETITINEKFNMYYIFDRKLIVLFPVIFSTYFLSAQTFSSMNLIALKLFGIAYVGILSTILWIGMVFGALSVGRISDVYKKQTLLYVLTALGIIGALLFIGTSNIILVILGTIMLGIFVSAAYPVCLSLLKQNSSEKEYIYALGAFQVYSNIGLVVGLLFSMNFTPQLIFFLGIIFLFVSFSSIFLYNKHYSN